jgi:hypothetical protein
LRRGAIGRATLGDDVKRYALVVMSALLACGACAPREPGDKAVAAIAAVAREQPAGISASDLASEPIPRGAGVVVYVKNRKAPGVAWVVLDGQAYACNDQTKMLAPKAPRTVDAGWDTWKQTGLDAANTASFLQIVEAAEARLAAR